MELRAKGPEVVIGPDSTSATASASMAEKGFIVTRGSTARASSAMSDSRSGTPNPHYMWDEPWSGDNAPRTMLNHKIEEEDPDKIDIEDGIVATAAAKRVSITPQRANTIRVSTSTTITRSPSRAKSGINTLNMEQKGIGILPSATSSLTIDPPESIDEEDDMTLPIQGTPISDSSPSHISDRLSWLKFDTDPAPETARPQTSDAAPGWKRMSWFDDRSHEDLHAKRTGSARGDQSFLDARGEDSVGEARERGLRTLDMDQRREELGWDLQNNWGEGRERWL